MKHRRTLAALAAAALAFTLAACSSDDSQLAATDREFVIGTAVIVAHPALEAAQAGFEDVLTEEGLAYRVIFQNAQGDVSNAATIASAFAADGNIDLIFAISTPIALAMASAEFDRPILFSAVTDPVDAGLVPSWEVAGANVSGTSDGNPDASPVGLVQRAMPDVQRIGVLYSAAEANSIIQVNQYREDAANYGVEIVPQAVTSAAEISVGLAALRGVDAILVPTDNTIVAAIASVVAWGQENQVPVFAAEDSSVALGAVASPSMNYYELGRRTGEMAVLILRDGVDIATIAPEAPTSTAFTINTGAAASFGLELPADFIAEASADVPTEQ